MTSIIAINGYTGPTGQTGCTGTFSGVIYQDVIPYTPNNVNLGNSSNYFNSLYVTTVNVVVNDVVFANINSNMIISGTYESTSTDTGALEVAGGVGIKSNLFVGGNIISLGKIGIGKSDPVGGVALDVSGSVVFGSITQQNPSIVLNGAKNGGGSGKGALGIAYATGNYSGDASGGDTVLRSQADNLILQSGIGACAIYINTSNQVGIGRLPGTLYYFDVSGSTRTSGNYVTSGNQTTGGIYFTGDIAAAQWQMCLTGSYQLGFRKNNGSGTYQKLSFIDSSGSYYINSQGTGAFGLYATNTNGLATNQSGSYNFGYQLQMGYNDVAFNADGTKYVTAGSINLQAQTLQWSSGAINVYGAKLFLEGGKSPNGSQVPGSAVISTNNTERMRINENGSVNIGGSNFPNVQGKLIIQGTNTPLNQQIVIYTSDSSTDAKYWCMGPNGNTFYFYTYNDAYTASANYMYVTRSGNTITGVYFPLLAGSGNRPVYSDPNGMLTNSASDRILKTNIQDISYGLTEVLNMHPVSYNWKDTEKRGDQKEIGFIAQEMQEIIPEVIGINNDETLSLDYSKITAVLVNAIKEQQTQYRELESKYLSQQTDLDHLKAFIQSKFPDYPN